MKAKSTGQMAKSTEGSEKRQALGEISPPLMEVPAHAYKSQSRKKVMWFAGFGKVHDNQKSFPASAPHKLWAHNISGAYFVEGWFLLRKCGK